MSHWANTPRVVIVAILAATLVLTGCNRAKRGNGTPPQSDIDAIEPTNPLLPDKAEKIQQKYAPDTGGIPVEAITSLVVEPTVDGAIIRVEGLASRQGAYDARLIPVPAEENSSPSTLALTFKVYYPRANTAIGNEASRKIQVAESLTVKQLEGIRVIRVSGATNTRETRRR